MVEIRVGDATRFDSDVDRFIVFLMLIEAYNTGPSLITPRDMRQISM